MKLLFENTTKYSKDVYDTFLAFHRKKYRTSYIAYNLFVIAFILFSLIMQIKYHNLTIAILLYCGLTFFILWRYLRPISEVAKEYKSDKIQNEQKFTFKFFEKLFKIEDNKEFSEIKYYKLYKVFETNDFFYLYIDKTHSFIIDKSKFKDDKASEFSKFIKKKCWWNYRLV